MTSMNAGELDGGFIGLSSAVGDIALADLSGGDLGQFFRQSDNGLIRKQRGGVLELFNLSFDLGGDAGIAMAYGDGHDAAEEIQVFVAVGVPEVLHAGMVGYQRLGVIIGDGR